MATFIRIPHISKSDYKVSIHPSSLKFWIIVLELELIQDVIFCVSLILGYGILEEVIGENLPKSQNNNYCPLKIFSLLELHSDLRKVSLIHIKNMKSFENRLLV